ncbi:MAG TPA: tetratricopeptide repeat protein [Longimicrobiaceae bacterium]|nr:tetratricopeptide repeat protein [Longimicrobiaceae bacterium]
MKRSQREAALRGSTHLLRLSLPAVRSNGSFEGADILGESGAGPAAVLYQVYRSVMAWALTPAAEHSGLFAPGAGDETRHRVAEAEVPRELVPALETVCELLDDPAGADPGRISEACLRIGEWADSRGDTPATALRFLQAAATCSPNDARVAYRAGCAARRRAVWDVAELWFRHASAVSRRKRDWEAHATAYAGLGNSYYRQGRYLPAEREHLKALRIARRHGLRDLQGGAYHDLFAVTAGLGNVAKAEEYGRSAFRAYGSDHKAIPALAHDLGYFWITQGEHQRALPVFQALRPHFRDAETRMRVLATLVHAAGGAREAAVFREAWTEAWDLTSKLEESTALTTSLLEMAYGAVKLSEWDLAHSAAVRALGRAGARGEIDVIVPAEQVLSSICTLRGQVQSPASPTRVSEADEFAADLVSSLVASTATV